MTFALWLTFNKPVGLSGLEPPTSRLSGVRSNQLSYKPISRNLLIPSGFSNAVSPNLGTSSSVMGILTCVQFRIHVRKQASFHSCVSCPRVRKILHGDEEIRTLDPLLARQVLSQLSYIPFLIWRPPALPHRLQCSTIGRSGLNRRVRDGYGCFP